MTCVVTLQCYCGALIVQAHDREVFNDHDNEDCDTLIGKGFQSNGGEDETPEFHIIWSHQSFVFQRSLAKFHNTQRRPLRPDPEKALTSGPREGPYVRTQRRPLRPDPEKALTSGPREGPYLAKIR